MLLLIYLSFYFYYPFPIIFFLLGTSRHGLAKSSLAICTSIRAASEFCYILFKIILFFVFCFFTYSFFSLEKPPWYTCKAKSKLEDDNYKKNGFSRPFFLLFYVSGQRFLCINCIKRKKNWSFGFDWLSLTDD